mmetsp:Transcript_5285/g.11057  ORF Transcript_5285/g.11057 Transcript_5285/m.11057 type:complete len:278 (+) Transcript_5285:251-1084(+)
MPSTAAASCFGFPPKRIAGAILAVIAACSTSYGKALLNHEAFQVLALTLASIVSVSIVAGILICIPDTMNGRHRSRTRRSRGRRRHRTRHHNIQNYRRSSRSRERLNQNEYPSSSSTTIKSVSSDTTTTTSSRKKAPSMPPLPITPRMSGSGSGSNKKNNTPGRVPVSGPSAQRTASPRRYSSPPSLPSQAQLSHFCLNPIVERKLEDLMDYDDYWWRELDSRTQYYALILGYTQMTWDDDFDIDDLPCEDWDWDEMTKEQKAAAVHFGYNEETWTD